MSLGLVAYGNSSDEESDAFSDSETEDINKVASTSETKGTESGTDLKKTLLHSPNPVESQIDPNENNAELKFNLPNPKSTTPFSNGAEEVDDEFLAKKLNYLKATIEKPPAPIKRATVKITIPALSKFDDDLLKKKVVTVPLNTNKPSRLLDLLPKPSVFHLNKQGSSSSSTASTSSTKPKTSLVPDSIKKNIENKAKKEAKLALKQNSSDSESDTEDFFSFNSKEKLPEVSQNEINAMVAKKVAQISTATNKFLEKASAAEEEQAKLTEEENNLKRIAEIDQQHINALCGSQAKKSRRGGANNDEIRIIDLSGDQVMPNRDEWLRNQLTATTEYQPRGLVEEDPGAGTKKKHQITYLAHQAKANEQELQAMWAANRHTRRQTQNKYGF